MTRRSARQVAASPRTGVKARPKAASPAERRTRQVCVANILEHLFGGLDRCPPRAWKQRAYWMLAGLVYERLAVDQESLSTSEVVALAKALTERGRSTGATRRSGGQAGRRAGVADSRARLQEMIHDIYGVRPPGRERRPEG